MIKRIFNSAIILLLLLGNVVNAQIKVSCAGNSITAGYLLGANDFYPTQLGKKLGSGYNVGNFGASGTTYLINNAWSYWASNGRLTNAKNFNPNIVVIELGTNDSKSDYTAILGSLLSDIKKMIDEFAALPTHPTIYLCIPPPAFNGNFGISNPVMLATITPAIKQAAADKGVNIIDLYTPLKDHPELFTDGIHPNPAGAGVIAQIVADAIGVQIKVISVSLDTHTLSINGSESKSLISTINPADASNKIVSWSSGNASIATVDANGSVTGKSEGSCTITVTTSDGHFRDSCSVIVNPVPVTGIMLTQDSVSVKLDLSLTLTASILPAGALHGEMIWFSSDTAIARVLPDGTVKGLSIGATYIKVKAISGGFADSCFVQVIPNGQRPYLNKIHNIPGIIEAEDFDEGGEGVAYHDFEPANLGLSTYRPTEGVDIEDNSKINLAYTENGEWIEYTVNVTKAGKYSFAMSYATPNSGSISVKLGDVVLGTIPVSTTGGWITYKTTTIDNISFTETGEKVIRLEFTSTTHLANIDLLEFILVTTGIQANPVETLFSLYPNPANDRVSIKASEKVHDISSISVVDLNGKTIRLKANPSFAGGIYELDLSGIPNGIYFLKITTGKDVLNSKLVIGK